MNNKKIAVIISAFIAVLFIIIGIIAIAGHIPFFGKPLTLIFAIIKGENNENSGKCLPAWRKLQIQRWQ